jgi:hypothetical protein
MKRLYLLFVCCFPLLSFAQQWEREHVGVQIQLLATVGAHRTSVGIKLNTYVAFDYAQLNIGTAYRFSKLNLGGRMNFGEWRHHTGLVVMAGKENNPVNFNWDGALHQSKRPYSIGYSYLWYVDKVGTTQRSGTWNFGIRRVDVQFENDVFGGQGKDRFRTGNFYVSYRDEQRSVGLGFMIWTGESAHSIWNRTPMNHAPSGYRDLTPLPYGKSSHGVLYFGGQQTFAGKQVASLQAGVDSEQIRHLFQNRLIHDLLIFPKKMKRNTPHYPRLNANGENVFSKREKRPDVLYFQTSVNDLFLY